MLLFPDLTAIPDRVGTAHILQKLCYGALWAMPTRQFVADSIGNRCTAIAGVIE